MVCMTRSTARDHDDRRYSRQRFWADAQPRTDPGPDRGRAIQFINLQFTDVMGIVKSVTIPAGDLRACHRGRAVDRRLVDRRVHPHRRIGHVPDARSLDLRRCFPGRPIRIPTARVICWVFNPNGDPFPGDPRGVLYRQLERLAKLGYLYKTGPELEFFLFSKDGDEISPLPHDRGGYFDFSTDLASHDPQGHGDRARQDGDRGRGQPPRGRDRPARDRLRIRRRACRPPTAR